MSKTHRRVLLAKPRGYCAGVDRAVQAVEIALGRFGAPVYVRKQIVHNTHVVNELEKRGAVFVEDTDEVPEGGVVVFSAHGIAPEVRAAAERRGLRAIDATCPLVTKVHNEARRFAANDYDILLIGHQGHEEVVGTTGEAPSRVRLIDGPAGASAVEVRDPSKVVWLSQTTLSVDETVQTVAALKERFPQLIDPPSDDICYATQNRQAAVKAIARDAESRGLHAIDATCPLVTKVHNEARRFAAKDYDILLVGHEGHEEVVGTAGEAPSRVRLVDGADGAAQVEVRDPSKVVWLSQTTLSVDETIQTVNALRERFPALLDPPSDDICYATQNRQAAVKAIAAQADLVIVVGSPNSSNSVRLVEVARDYGTPAAYLVDDAGEIDEGWLDGVTTIGVTSGASVPEELVAAVLDTLAGYGFGDVEEVEAVEEHMTFALPRELRPAGSRRDG